MPFFYARLNDEPASTGYHAADLAAAKCEATKMAGRIICDDAATFRDRAEWSLTVTDEDDLTLFQLQFIGVESAAIRKFETEPPL
jgi:hypothetical protein